MTSTKRPRSGSGGGGFFSSRPHYQLHGGDVRAVQLPERLARLCRSSVELPECSAPHGSPELRRAFSDTFQAATAQVIDPNCVLACRTGATMALQLALASLPRYSTVGAYRPMWFGFAPLVEQMEHGIMFGSVEIDGYQVTAEQLDEMLTIARQRHISIGGVILNNMGTPTGRAWTRSQVRELGAVALRYPEVTIIEDCLFWRSAHPGRNFHTLGGECPELLERDQLIGCASLSKGWPLEDLSLGFLWANPQRLRKIRFFVDAWQTQPTDGMQHCAGDALVGSGRDTPLLLSRALASNAASLRSLCATSHFRMACDPDGGTNALLDVSAMVELKFDGRSICCDECLAKLLRRHAGVELYPGVHFGCQQNAMRVNLAGCTQDEFAAAAGRLQEFSDACY